MLTFVPACTDGDFAQILDLIYNQRSAWLEPRLDLVGLTWDCFGLYLRKHGKVYRVLSDGLLAGMCWVEPQGKVLLLHGLVVAPGCQGLGIGTATLGWLEKLCAGQYAAIELRVHPGNRGARRLYDRLGYRPAGEDCGFLVLRKELAVDPKRLAARLHKKNLERVP